MLFPRLGYKNEKREQEHVNVVDRYQSADKAEISYTKCLSHKMAQGMMEHNDEVMDWNWYRKFLIQLGSTNDGLDRKGKGQNFKFLLLWYML